MSKRKIATYAGKEENLNGVSSLATQNLAEETAKNLRDNYDDLYNLDFLNEPIHVKKVRTTSDRSPALTHNDIFCNVLFLKAIKTVSTDDVISHMKINEYRILFEDQCVEETLRSTTLTSKASIPDCVMIGLCYSCFHKKPSISETALINIDLILKNQVEILSLLFLFTI